MSSITNRRLLLARRPSGAVEDDCFRMETSPVEPPGPGQVLVRTLWLAFEPAQRGWLNEVRSYTAPMEIGEVMRAWGLGQIERSNHDSFPEGALVHGTLNWQEWGVHAPGTDSDIELVPEGVDDPTLMLSVAGITGMTAYFGMHDIGRPTAGDTVLVTAAAGATGSVAGQIARLLGARRVIGTAGSPTKQAWVRDIAGFDECLDHHDPDVRKHLRAAAPDGLDVIYDNVGGALLDAAIARTTVHARIALCGSISTGYRPERPAVGLHNYQVLTTNRVRMEGFLLNDFEDRFPEARERLLAWAADGSIRVQHDVLEGLERAPEGLRRLFEGANLGKQLLLVSGAGDTRSR
jgi:NADPH-dependent curcumin reductase CurA